MPGFSGAGLALAVSLVVRFATAVATLLWNVLALMFVLITVALRALWATVAASVVVGAALLRRSRVGRIAERRVRIVLRSPPARRAMTRVDAVLGSPRARAVMGPAAAAARSRRVRYAAAGALAAITLGAVAAAASSGNHPPPRVGADGGIIIAAIPQAAAPVEPLAFGTIPGPAPTTAAARRTSAPAVIEVSASDLAADGIPSTALTAYERAAGAETAVDPSCHLGWPLLAGIGRVESDHGRFAGAVLHTDGLSTPKVIGIPLNGHGTALIRDTDHGRLDGDTVYDRAVGPMQFIPSTWASYGMDGNGDHIADPFNIFDAARTAARYLCAVGADLNTTAGQVQAIRAYNDSDTYISLVMSVESQYAQGAGLITPTPPPSSSVPTTKPKLPPADPGAPLGVPTAGPTSKPTTSPTPSNSPSTSPSSSASTSASDSGTPSDSGSATPTSTDSGSPTSSGSTTDSTTPSATATLSSTPAPSSSSAGQTTSAS
ncbi:MAG TPA: lytic murein transglycosylase [Jatrophihabitantaceae bacterium]|jgi:membrane-bound lytic murein transglycosylase B